jgi:hypothetical protein
VTSHSGRAATKRTTMVRKPPASTPVCSRSGAARIPTDGTSQLISPDGEEQHDVRGVAAVMFFTRGKWDRPLVTRATYDSR